MSENKFEKLVLLYIHLRNRLSDYWKLNLIDPHSDELYYVFEDQKKEKIDETLKKLGEKGLLTSSYSNDN